MSNTLQHSCWISGLRWQAPSFALALMLLPAVVATRSAHAQTFTLLHTFAGGSDGAVPLAGLVPDGAGNLYGTTVYGGDSGCSAGCGTVFKLDAAGTETVLYRFTGGADGSRPLGSVVLDAMGNLYGTTVGSGAANFGTVFKLDTVGTETVLYSFTGPPDGAYPAAGVVRNAVGELYGTTVGGGPSKSGTVFKLDTAGTETVLNDFTGGADGSRPVGSLVLDSADNLYGTTSEGGDSNSGTVFKLDALGIETVLYNFTGRGDGGAPQAGLVLDAAGNLYSTAARGASWIVSTVPIRS